jgi:hypothetical protein
MKSKKTIKPKLLVLGLGFIFSYTLSAQRVITETELSKAYPLADKAWAKRFVDNFVFTFNYTLENVKDFKDYNAIRKTALEGERKYYEKEKIKMPTQITREPENTRVFLTKKDLMVSENLRNFYLQVLDSLEKSNSSEEFSSAMLELKKAPGFTSLNNKDKKVASSFVLCLDYLGQVMPPLIEKLEAKPGINKSTRLNRGRENDKVGHLSYNHIDLSSDLTFKLSWTLVKCALGTIGGGAAGFLGGAAAGSAVPVIGTSAGALIGGLAGVATGAASSCA